MPTRKKGGTFGRKARSSCICSPCLPHPFIIPNCRSEELSHAPLSELSGEPLAACMVDEAHDASKEWQGLLLHKSKILHNFATET